MKRNEKNQVSKQKQPSPPEQSYENDEGLMIEEDQVLPSNIKPIKLLVKYEPPLVGLLYYDLDNKNKKHIYNVLLNGLINSGDPSEITKFIFLEHATFFNDKTVNFKQVERMVVKILEYFIQLANLDEEQLAQYYAMGGRQNEEYMDEGEGEEAVQVMPDYSPVKKQNINNNKNKKKYEEEEFEIRNNNQNNNFNLVQGKKKNNAPKYEALSD